MASCWLGKKKYRRVNWWILQRKWNARSEGYYEEGNHDNMYNFPNEAGRPIPVASPNTPRSKINRKESGGYYAESWSTSSPLTRETLKRNTEEGSKREVNKRISS